MGTFFLDNQDKNLLKVTFDIVSSIYYYLDTIKYLQISKLDNCYIIRIFDFV